MSFNVISCIEIAKTKTLKIGDFTCNLGFGPQKLPKSLIAMSLYTQFLRSVLNVNFHCLEKSPSVPDKGCVSYYK